MKELVENYTIEELEFAVEIKKQQLNLASSREDKKSKIGTVKALALIEDLNLSYNKYKALRNHYDNDIKKNIQVYMLLFNKNHKYFQIKSSRLRNRLRFH